MKRWILRISSGVHRKDGTFKRNEDEQVVYEGDEIIDVAKKVWLEHFRYGDNIDDYGTCKLECCCGDKAHTAWTVVRETDEGEFRGIFRLDVKEEK